MHERLVDTLRLNLVTDSALCGERGVLAVVEAAVAGGVSCVQLREKSLPTRAFVERARALKAWLAPRGVPLIINDRVDVALASGADYTSNRVHRTFPAGLEVEVITAAALRAASDPYGEDDHCKTCGAHYLAQHAETCDVPLEVW